ncbi:hypothetical protein GGR58DRAFT_277212 [Xylaria digitata]|nr:hypothetical protein GGR58DRAFT_277212 [Xylaria digitata]
MKNFIRSKASLVPVKLTDPAQEFARNRVTINSRESIPEIEEYQEEQASSQSTEAISKDDVEEDIHCKQFAEVLRSFEESLPDHLKTRFSLQSKHTWAEVVSEAKFAELQYNKKVGKESPFGRVRGLFRALRSNSPAISDWLDLLPTDSLYGSLICGGLKVILRAATRMDEIKEFLLAAMAAIPDEVEKAQLLIDYNADQDTTQRLYNSVSSLYYSVFDILNHVIIWYKEKSLKRHAKAFLQQDSYEEKLKAKVDTFKRAISAAKDEADICGLRRLKNLDERTQKLLDMHKEIVQFLRSNPKLDPHTGQWRQYSLGQPAAQARKRRAISRQSLCDAVLRYDEDVPPADLAAIMHGANGLSLKAQDRIVYVIESETLQAWLLNPRNAALLIRGNVEHLGDGGTSAISFVAGRIIQSTQEVQHASRLLGLFWFAQRHQSKRNDADANVHGVVRSLIGQLVHAYGEFDLSFIRRSQAKAIRENNDLETLCNIFDDLILQLPDGTITMCVIDSLGSLEYHEKKDVNYLIQRLLSIVRCANENGSLFKLLLTHPGGTFWAASTFAKAGDVLQVPEDGNGKGMGFNKLMWDANVDDKFERLATKSMK